MTVDSFSRPETYPEGTIVIWTSPISEIPDGWVLCDGNNGSPNLLDKFVKSVPDATTDPGFTGGDKNVQLSSPNLPSHTHSSSNMEGVGDHYHTHSYDRTAIASGNDHSGDITSPITLSNSGGHSHNVGTTNSGGSGSIDNQPQFSAQAFIQKT